MKDQTFLDEYITLKRKIIDADAALRAAQAEQKALVDQWAEGKANAAGFQVGGVYLDTRGWTTNKPGLVQIVGVTAGIVLTKGKEGKSDTRCEWDYQADLWVRYRYENKSGGWSANEHSLPLDTAKRVFVSKVEVSA